jgi:NAD(P) transhydrogenase
MAAEIEYDLAVIGSGPGGQKAALAAAKLGKKVAVIEHRQMLGGVCVNTGTIPSKTLREAVMYLTGMNQRELYGASYRVKERITPADLHERTTHVVKREIEVIRDQLVRNRVDLFTGHGRFVDEHTVSIEAPNEAEHRTVTADSSSSRPERRRDDPMASPSTKIGCWTPTKSFSSNPFRRR